MIYKALKALGAENFTVSGNVTNEAEFNTAVQFVSVSLDGTAIYETDPTKWPVTWAQVQTKITELEALPSEQYKFDRGEAYASYGEQLDMQYHDKLNGTTTWADHIASIKSAHPKPGE